jgi:hypothetical protein
MKTKQTDRKKSLKKLALQKRVISNLHAGMGNVRTSTVPTCSVSTPAYCKGLYD